MRGPNFNLSLERLAGADVLRISGEVDIATGPMFVRQLSNALRPDRGLIVDMRAVTYIDLRGVRALEEASVRARTAGQRLVVVSSNSLVHRLFSILQLQGHTTLVNTIEDAMRLADPARQR
ncbi:MAG TPA: STAS domain-containing protein [bacterium]|nr:STAS domain-containing protein [bacterium]